MCRINNKLPIKSDLLELQLKALVAESPNPTQSPVGGRWYYVVTWMVDLTSAGDTGT